MRLSPEALVFVTERHYATLTTLRRDGTPHVVPVAFTWDQESGVARVTTERGAVKARNIARTAGGARVALCQVSGGRWITLEGVAHVTDDAAEVAEAERRHAVRYPPLEADPARVLIRVVVDAVMGSDYLAT